MWIQVFKSGEHFDSSGKKHNYGVDDLDKMSEMYNSKVESSDSYEAPLVKGHPKHDAPAYGWVERLKRRGDVLYAKFKNLSSKLVDDVQKGKFKKVSIALYPDMMLRHIGLLGAGVPSVKGLKTVQFSDSQDFIKFNHKDAPSDESFDIAFNNLIKENDELKSKINELKNKLKTIEFNEFTDDLIDGDVFNSGTKQQIIDILFSAEKLDNSSSEFNEENNLVDKIKEFLSSLKNHNGLFRELDLDSSSQNNQFIEYEQMDAERLDLHNKILELQRKNKDMDYEEAFNQINQ